MWTTPVTLHVEVDDLPTVGAVLRITSTKQALAALNLTLPASCTTPSDKEQDCSLTGPSATFDFADVPLKGGGQLVFDLVVDGTTRASTSCAWTLSEQSCSPPAG